MFWLTRSTVSGADLGTMGLLTVGKPLSWKDSLEHCNYIRQHGILQFINTYNRLKFIENDRLLYGDEIEYALLKLDTENKKVRLSLRGSEMMQLLREKEAPEIKESCSWHQEFGSWMLEGTPSRPYTAFTASLVNVEQNMRLRRGRLRAVLAADEIAPTMVTFPLMGVGDFVSPAHAPGGDYAQSDYVPDACINPHPRFGTLTANIRERRGGKVDIRVPLFRDKETPEFADKKDAAVEPYIHMDCMAFGMGNCCLQVTFQASDMDESRYMYDQLAILAPLMMALTASTPILKGRLANTDARWSTISQSVDDRTPAERGDGHFEPNPCMAGQGTRLQSKSRYDSISSFIHWSSWTPGFNDVPCEIDEDLKKVLIENHVDEHMAHHMAHLFTRDPLVCFEGHIELDDEASTDHFESIQSTNWQTVRWKPPPVPSGTCAPHIGWRTEFRSMEVQLTDFENAAFTAFVVLVTRAIIVFDLSLLTPLSKVDENMRRAHQLGAATKSKFWFRKQIVPDATEAFSDSTKPPNTEDAFEEMTMNEIMNGKSNYYPGLLPLCYAYLDHIRCDGHSWKRIDQYLKLIQKRSTGELLTPATWMRKFVCEHEDYKKDSTVPDSIAFDLVVACDEIGMGKRTCRDILGDVRIDPISAEGTYKTPLDRERMGDDQRRHILQTIMSRAAVCDGPDSAPSGASMRRQTSGRSPSPSYGPGSAPGSRKVSEFNLEAKMSEITLEMKQV